MSFDQHYGISTFDKKALQLKWCTYAHHDGLPKSTEDVFKLIGKVLKSQRMHDSGPAHLGTRQVSQAMWHACLRYWLLIVITSCSAIKREGFARTLWDIQAILSPFIHSSLLPHMYVSAPHILSTHLSFIHSASTTVPTTMPHRLAHPLSLPTIPPFRASPIHAQWLYWSLGYILCGGQYPWVSEGRGRCGHLQGH